MASSTVAGSGHGIRPDAPAPAATVTAAVAISKNSKESQQIGKTKQLDTLSYSKTLQSEGYQKDRKHSRSCGMCKCESG